MLYLLDLVSMPMILDLAAFVAVAAQRLGCLPTDLQVLGSCPTKCCDFFFNFSS